MFIGGYFYQIVLTCLTFVNSSYNNTTDTTINIAACGCTYEIPLMGLNWISEIFSNLKYLIGLSYVGLFAIFISSCFFSKYIMRLCYTFYNIIYRSTMIILRAIFIILACQTGHGSKNALLENLSNRYDCVVLFLWYTFLFENTNILAFYFKGQQITMKRIVHILCTLLLLVQCIYGYVYFPIILLLVVHYSELIKDFLNLLSGTSIFASYIYGIFMPLMLNFAMYYSIYNMGCSRMLTNVSELIIPISFVMVSNYNAYHVI